MPEIAISVARPQTIAVVIDDNPQIQKRFQLLLRKYGVNVFCAGDGEVGIQMVRSVRPDVVFIDLKLPRLSGLDVCEAIRGDPLFAELPLLIVSGRTLPTDRARAAEMGASGYLVKPFKGEEVIAEVRRFISLTKIVDRHC